MKSSVMHLCLDARKMNAFLPFTNWSFNRLPKTRFPISLDRKDAFWQILLDEVSKDKTVFSVLRLRKTYQTKYQLLICDIKYSYINDLLFFLETSNQHLLLLTAALCISRAGLRLKIWNKKFIMMKTSHRYLGHIVGNVTICIDPDKVRVISDFSGPKTAKQV